MGLYVVEQIVNSHKGYIFAESRVGEGSRKVEEYCYLESFQYNSTEV